MRWLVACTALLFALTSAYAAPADPPARMPDLLLLGGKVFTADSARPWAMAVATAGERVLAVGDDAAMAAQAGPRTRVIGWRAASWCRASTMHTRTSRPMAAACG